MTRKYIPVDKWGNEQLKRPEFKAAYDALENEFDLVSALIEGEQSGQSTSFDFDTLVDRKRNPPQSQ